MAQDCKLLGINQIPDSNLLGHFELLFIRTSSLHILSHILSNLISLIHPHSYLSILLLQTHLNKNTIVWHIKVNMVPSFISYPLRRGGGRRVLNSCHYRRGHDIFWMQLLMSYIHRRQTQCIATPLVFGNTLLEGAVSAAQQLDDRVH